MDKVAEDIAPYFASKAEAKRALAELTKRILHRKILQGRSKAFDDGTIAREGPGGGQKRKAPDEDLQENNGDADNMPPAKKPKITEPAQAFEFAGHTVPAAAVDAFVSKIEDLMEVDTGLAQTAADMAQSWSRPGAAFPKKAIFDISDDETYAHECLVLCTALSEEVSPIPMAVYVLGLPYIADVWKSKVQTQRGYVPIRAFKDVVSQCVEIWNSMEWRSFDSTGANFNQKCTMVLANLRSAPRSNKAIESIVMFELGSIDLNTIRAEMPETRDFVAAAQTLLMRHLQGKEFVSGSLYQEMWSTMQAMKQSLMSFWNSYDVEPLDVYTEKVLRRRQQVLFENEKLYNEGATVSFLASRFSFAAKPTLEYALTALPMQRLYAKMLQLRDSTPAQFRLAEPPAIMRAINAARQLPFRMHYEYLNKSLALLMAAVVLTRNSQNIFQDSAFEDIVTSALRLEEARPLLKSPGAYENLLFTDELEEFTMADLQAYELASVAFQTANIEDEDEFFDEEVEYVEYEIDEELKNAVGDFFARPGPCTQVLAKFSRNTDRLANVNLKHIGVATITAFASYSELLYVIDDRERTDLDELLVEFNELVLKEKAVAVFWRQVVDNCHHKTPFTFLMTDFFGMFPLQTASHRLFTEPMIDGVTMWIENSFISLRKEKTEFGDLLAYKSNIVCSRNTGFQSKLTPPVEFLYARLTVAAFIRYIRATDKTSVILFDLGYTLRNGYTEHPVPRDVNRRVILDWISSNIFPVEPSGPLRKKAVQVLRQISQNPNVSWGPQLGTSCLFVDMIAHVPIDVGDGLPVVSSIVDMYTDEITPESLEANVRHVFSSSMMLQNVVRGENPRYRSDKNIFVSADSSIDFEIRVREGKYATATVKLHQALDIDKFLVFLKNFDTLAGRLSVDSSYVNFVLKNDETLEPSKVVSLASMLLEMWFVPTQISPDKILTRSAAVVGNYDFATWPPAFNNAVIAKEPTAATIAQYWANAMQKQNTAFIGLRRDLHGYLIQTRMNDGATRWLLLAGLMPSYQSLYPKIDMKYIVPNMRKLPFNAVTLQSSGAFVLNEEPEYEFLPVIRYSTRTGATPYNESPAGIGEFRGTFYYFEPSSSTLLNTQMKKVSRYLTKYEAATTMIEYETDWEERVSATAAEQIRSYWDFYMEQIEQAKCPVNKNPFTRDYGHAWISLLLGDSVEIDIQKVDLVEGVPFSIGGQYTKPKFGEKWNTITLRQISKTPQYFMEMLDDMCSLCSPIDEVLYRVFKTSGAKVVVFEMEPTRNGMATEILDTRSRVASYDALVSIAGLS